MLDEARSLPPIQSGYVTSRVMRLQIADGGEGHTWELRPVDLSKSHEKTYDDGRLDDLLELYRENVPVECMHFLAAYDPRPIGLLVWARMTWNNTVWLIDIRVRSNKQRRGVGRRLLGELREKAVQLGVRGISVETQINNYPALCFYRNNGFRIAGFNDSLYTNNDLVDQDVACFLFQALNSRVLNAH
ncbi:MAG: hypothetical protein DLM70_13580 [Chloroflexi bacterium]|nr:MAG: hypothetical protein DLM70_13580 [Chloroflexota bacterium]